MEVKEQGHKSFEFTPEQAKIDDRITQLLEELGQLTVDMSKAGLPTSMSGCLYYKAETGARSANIAFGTVETLQESAVKEIMDTEQDLLNLVDSKTGKLNMPKISRTNLSYVTRLSYLTASLVLIAQSPKLFTIYVPKMLNTASEFGIKSLLFSSMIKEGDQLPIWSMTANRAGKDLATVILTNMAKNELIQNALKLSVEHYEEFMDSLKGEDGFNFKRVQSLDEA